MKSILSKFTTAISSTLAIAIVITSSYVNAQGLVSDSQERSALLALYNSTQGGNAWIKRWTLTQINGYPDSIPYGVSVFNGDIIEIELNSNGLEGPLPTELNRLKSLQILSLSGNKINGAIPILDSLTNLKTLNLANHYFTGAFPSWIGTLTSLEVLNLSSYLLDPAKLTGPIPSDIQNLIYLRSLDLANNDFSSPSDIPNEFSFLDNLTYLNLDGCQLTPSSVTTGLSGLTNLIQMNLSNNASYVDSNGIFPSSLINLPSLQYLYLRGNGFSEFPTSFTGLNNLYLLDLSRSNYADTARLGSTIDVLKNIPSLKYIDLSLCQITALPLDFDGLTIETLILSNNPLDAERCNDLGDMPVLKSLYLNSCSLESIPSNLSSSSSLQLLSAWYNNLQPVPEEIKDIPNLQTLELGSNAITSLPEWFGTGAMDTLRRLVLSNNQLVTLPDNFTNLKNLKELVVANNQLNGTWPENFSSLIQVTLLDLQNNKIVSLPDLTNWQSLQQVFLQNNLLAGEVPSFLSNTNHRQLSVVNISYNQYSSIDTTSHFDGTSPIITVHNNQFTFEDILEFKPANGTYLYSPQPQVDTIRDVFSYPGSSFTLLAAVDTTLRDVKPKFQWFKYIDGINDSALFSAPSTSAYNYTIQNTLPSDEGNQYYYKITHPDAPELTLTSKLQTLVFSCQRLITGIDFKDKRYLCALNFKPLLNYTNACRTLNYLWDFGDGSTSTEKSPWHVYSEEGTHSVSLTVNFDCGSCQSDSTITKEVLYSLPDQFLRDSLVEVQTDTRNGIISVSASTFSDSWPLQQPNETLNVNSYLNGQQGVWRNDAEYVYDVPRSRSLESNIAKDGTFTLENFNWQHAALEAIPNWIKANSISLFSPFSYELENVDVLNIHSSALYDYGGHLPSANGVNMRNNEMAFTGFEFLDNKSSGNLIFGNQPLPEYYLYNVKSAVNHIAVVEASVDQLSNVEKVDVSARGSSLGHFRRNNYIQEDPLLCIQSHPTVPSWSMIVLRRKPFSGLWRGQIKVKNDLQPITNPVIDTAFAHTGKSSLKVTSDTTFEQNLLRLDSGKTYFLNAWVSIRNPYVTSPQLASNLGIEVIFKDKNKNRITSRTIYPNGPIIEGWQQVRGSFDCPDHLTVVSLKFKAGGSGNAWYDDLRIHPEKGNMKSYVYNVNDYRLRAILDEENFATLYYYDDEGNLYLVKKETERGIKTISENVSYQLKNNEVEN